MTSESEAKLPPSVRILFAVALAVIAALVYGSSLSGGLVYDDLLLVERSPATQSIGAAFSRAFEPFFAFAQADSVTQRGLWRPMTSLFLAIGRTLGSTDDTFGFHLVSLLLHIASSLVVFRLAALMLRTRAGCSSVRADILGALTALLFVVHPTQVESVSWISAVNDPAWSFFALLALFAWERAAVRGKVGWSAALWSLLALLSKEQAVVILPLLLLLEATSNRRRDDGSPRPGVLPVIAVAVIPLALWYMARVRVFDEFGAGLLREHGDFGLSAMREVTFRIELLGGFIRHVVWPTDPAVFRPVRPVLPDGSHAVLLGTAFSLGTLALLVVTWRKGLRAAAFGLGAIVIVVAPIVATPDRAGLFPLSDRYLYLAVFGGALAFVALLSRLRPGALAMVATVICAALLSRITLSHQSTFEDDLTFRIAAVEDAPESPNTLWGTGRAYLAEYERTQNNDMLAEAYLHYLKSLKAVTIYGDGSFVDDTSLTYGERVGRLEKLILDTPPEERQLDPTVFATVDDRLQATLGQIQVNLLSAELSSSPDLDYPLLLAQGAKELGIWNDRPELDASLASIYAKRGELDNAKKAIGTAILRAPSNVDFRKQMGQLLLIDGEFDGARTTLRRAVELAPSDIEARFLLARAASSGGRYEVAEREIQEILGRTGGTDARPHVLQAAIDTKRGRIGPALEAIDKALAIDPNNGEAHKQRGLASLKRDDTDGALSGFAEASRLLPDDFESHYNLAALLLRQRPAPNATEPEVRSWQETVQPILARAYVLSPRDGQQQLLLQQQLEAFLGESPDASLNLAQFLYRQNRSTLALAWVSRATRFGTKWPAADRDRNMLLAHTMQGQIYRQINRPYDALAALQAAVAYGPDHFPAQFDLGDLLFQLKRFDEAEGHLQKALELFADADIVREMRMAVKDTIEGELRQIRSSR